MIGGGGGGGGLEETEGGVGRRSESRSGQHNYFWDYLTICYKWFSLSVLMFG